MVKKELFVETINFIKDRNDMMLKMNKLFAEEFTDSSFYPYFKYDSMLIRLLTNSFDYDENVIREYIDWFCWEKDFGRIKELGGIIIKENGEVKREIPIDTPEQLYDFLFEKACSFEK